MSKKYFSQDANQNRRCWKCKIPIPEPFQLNSVEMRFARPPMPGDISICAGCGAFGIFNGLLVVEKPDLVMMRRIMATERLVRMQKEILDRL